MRIFSILLAAVTILAPVAVLGEIETNAVKDTSVSDVLHDEDLEGVAARKLEFLNLEVDQKGCYLLTGPESGLLLLLCEDDAGARKRYTDEGILVDLAESPEETNEDMYSWVNGTITNLGEIAICNVAFASRDTDLTTDALDVVPINLPTTALDESLFDSVDLAPGESIDFAYFLPFNAARNAPAFVGLSKSLHACSEAKEKFVPELPEWDEVETTGEAVDKLVDAANIVVDATQETTGEMLDTTQQFTQGFVDGTQDKLDATIDSLQAVSKPPELADTTTTIPTKTQDKSVAEALEEPKAANTNALKVKVAAKTDESNSSVTEIPIKEAQNEAETTSPAGTRSASGSIILLGTIFVLSVSAFFA